MIFKNEEKVRYPGNKKSLYMLNLHNMLIPFIQEYEEIMMNTN